MNRNLPVQAPKRKECDKIKEGETNGIKELSPTELRQLIALYWQGVCNCEPHEFWKGRGGTISKIIEGLHLDKRQRALVEGVLGEAYQMIVVERGSYSGESSKERGWPKPKIADNSVEQSIIADYHENGFSIRETTFMVNVYRFKERLELVTPSAVYHCMLQMESRKAPALKKPAGDTNKDSKWARTNDQQSAQLLIRFGFGDKLNLERFKVDGVLPIGLQEDKLKPLKVTKTAWFDEVHQDCITGDNPNGQSSDVQYPRDADGNYDKDGAYVDQQVTVSTKYTQQVRQCWGVYVSLDDEGNEIGCRLPIFDYTAKTLISIDN